MPLQIRQERIGNPLGWRWWNSCVNAWRVVVEPLTQHRTPVGAGLLAKAVCQSAYLLLIQRIREQARSHILIVVWL
ncbi:hypothetical protein, partial [Pseudomonas sp. Larv2_ips]|uniref:hypothetical protein n=1 Tax=Pseudomonas sp. Larv2_ips TaxID=1896942 RepID=UPI001C49A740